MCNFVQMCSCFACLEKLTPLCEGFKVVHQELIKILMITKCSYQNNGKTHTFMLTSRYKLSHLIFLILKQLGENIIVWICFGPKCIFLSKNRPISYINKTLIIHESPQGLWQLLIYSETAVDASTQFTRVQYLHLGDKRETKKDRSSNKSRRY